MGGAMNSGRMDCNQNRRQGYAWGVRSKVEGAERRMGEGGKGNRRQQCCMVVLFVQICVWGGETWVGGGGDMGRGVGVGLEGRRGDIVVGPFFS